MELRHLRYFVALAEDLNYGRAAQRLQIAQPTLSTQIKDLEQELGFPLFERLPRGIRLAPAGQAFLPEARESLRHAEAAMRRAAAASRGEIGVFRVGQVDAAVDAGRLAALFGRFRAGHPNVALDLALMSTLDQLEALHADTLDVAFIYLAGEGPSELNWEWFVETPLNGVLLPAASPYADARRLSLCDLAELPMLMFPREVNPVAHDQLIAALRLRGARSPMGDNIPKANARGMALTPMILGSVAAGHGWLPTNDRMAESYHAVPGAVFRPFAEPPIAFGIAIAWRASGGSPLLQDFLELARARASVAPVT